MRFNQFSYLPVSHSQVLRELSQLGLKLVPEQASKKQLEQFVRWSFFTYTNTDYALSTLAADRETDLLGFFQSDKELTADIFYTVVFQLLGFNFLTDFGDVEQFRKDTGFPIVYGDLIENIYHLLNTRTKKGNTLIDQLVSDGLIAEDHDNINTYMEASKKESVYQCLYTLSIKTERNDTFASKEEIDACINK